VLIARFLAYTLVFVSIVSCRLAPRRQDEEESRWIADQLKQEQEQEQEQEN
jgi:hypothetical protein